MTKGHAREMKEGGVSKQMYSLSLLGKIKQGLEP